MKCKLCKTLIDKLCQADLTVPEKAALDAHIGECEACRRDYLAAVNLTRGDLALDPPELPGDFTAGVMQKIGQGSVKLKPARSRAANIRWYAAAACFAVVVVLAIFLTAENMRPTPGQAQADIEQTYQQARELFDEKKFEQSIEKFKEMLEDARSNPYILESGKYEDAAKFWIGLARIENEAKDAFTGAKLQALKDYMGKDGAGEDTALRSEYLFDRKPSEALAGYIKSGKLTQDEYNYLSGLYGRTFTDRVESLERITFRNGDGTTGVDIYRDDDRDRWHGDVHANDTVTYTAQTREEYEKALLKADQLLKEGKYDEASYTLTAWAPTDQSHTIHRIEELLELQRQKELHDYDTSGAGGLTPIEHNLEQLLTEKREFEKKRNIEIAKFHEDLVQRKTVLIEEQRRQLERDYKAARQLFEASEFGRAKKLYEQCLELIQWFPYPLDTGKDYENLSKQAVRECDRRRRDQLVMERERKEEIARKMSEDEERRIAQKRQLKEEIVRRRAELDAMEPEEGEMARAEILRMEMAEKWHRIHEHDKQLLIQRLRDRGIPVDETGEYGLSLEKLRDFGIPVEKIVLLKPPAPIDAKVVAFDEETGIALLSVGEGGNVQEGYEFNIYRGKKFLARAKVEKVMPDMCEAKVIFKVGDIQKGDSAATRLSAEAIDKLKKPPKKKTWKRSAKPCFARVYVGGGNSLELVSMQVKVTVEGPRARTLVDHIFYNPHDKQLQGTFEYPLPSGASPSYYAMFIGQQVGGAPAFSRKSELPANMPQMSPQEIVAHVQKKYWGELKEARIVKRETARKAYEEIVRRKIDPALLEYASANTFRGRVFPIPAKGYNRVIIAYEQTLEQVDEHLRYRFPLPDCGLKDLNFALTTRPGHWQATSCVRKDIEEVKGKNLLTYSGEWTKEGPGGEAVVSFTPARKDIQYISGLDAKRGPYYFYARLRPGLPEKEEKSFAGRAVFLVDTSLSEEPDRFNTSVKLLAKILESDAAIEKFQVLLFDVGARWLLEPEGFWLANTQESRKKALARLDEVLLEGATDLSIALEKLTAQKALEDKPLNIFLLSDGQVNWGTAAADQLVARFERKAKFPHKFFCYRTGLSAENLGLFGMLSRGGGAIFNCFTEDAIAKVATAHRSQCLQVTGVNAQGVVQVNELLVAGRKCALYPGGEMVVAGRCREAGDVVLEVTGTYAGKEMKFKFPLTVGSESELAPRAWGEIAVAGLVALNRPELDELITAYCQHFSIGSKVASFLVLETEADYKRFDISGELGEIEVKDVAQFLESQWREAGEELSAKERFRRFVARIEERTKLISGQSGEYVKKLLEALEAKDYEFSHSLSADKVLLKKDVAKEYLTSRRDRRRDVDIYTREAKRRAKEKETGAALRALSSVVELYPGRCDALRLTACRLLEMGEPACAAGLFWRVQESRPFEPQSYRDLARSYELAGRPGLAAVQYEILLAGKWHNRFLSLKQVVLEEYCMLMRSAIREKSVNARLSDLFAARLAALAKPGGEADLRVTISWNTDNTDIDLWVLEPDGEKCYYQHKQTKSGGTLLDDLTQGYGPERYHTQKAQKGLYTVKVHYFAMDANLLGGETYVTVTVTKFAGTDRQEIRRYNVVLKKSKQALEVCQVEF